MEIKVTISLDERTHETLNKLTEALAKEITVKAEMPAAKPEIKSTAAIKSTVDQIPAPAKKTAEKPTVASDKGDTPPWEDNSTGKPEKIDAETLRALAADVKKKKGSSSPIKELLNKYGAENITAVTRLDPKQVQAFRDELKGLL